MADLNLDSGSPPLRIRRGTKCFNKSLVTSLCLADCDGKLHPANYGRWLARAAEATALAKAWKMNGLAFENVNYREIQLTPGAKKRHFKKIRKPDA